MATASSLSLSSLSLKPLSFSPQSSTRIATPKSFNSKSFRCPPLLRKNRLGLVFCAHSAISRNGQGGFDPELRLVLELATDSELYELERILFGPSYFSPLLKSVANRSDVDYAIIGEDLAERERFIELLESQFLYLAADARSTLRGWRPSYREILLGVRRKLNIPCSSSLSTEDLEVEIFLHLLQDYSSGETDDGPHSWEYSKISNGQGTLEFGLSQGKVQAISALQELQSVIMKGGAMFTLGKIYQLLARRLSGKMVLEAANYQIKREIMKEGGKLAAIHLESRAALLAARQGLAGAASRFIGFQSMTMFLGPLDEFQWLYIPAIMADVSVGISYAQHLQSELLWGTFLADVVIQMLGTDYARILRAIYAFAQIRITRTYKWVSDKDQLV